MCSRFHYIYTPESRHLHKCSCRCVAVDDDEEDEDDDDEDYCEEDDEDDAGQFFSGRNPSQELLGMLTELWGSFHMSPLGRWKRSCSKSLKHVQLLRSRGN